MTVIPKPSSPNSQAKVPRVLFVQARSSPPGVVEKSSSPGGLAVFFPQPCMYGTRPFIACSYGNSGPEKPD